MQFGFFRGLCSLNPTMNLALQAVRKKGSGLQKPQKELINNGFRVFEDS
jgi:hypothetical protein